MRKILSQLILMIFILAISQSNLSAQRVYPLVTGITVDSILKVKPNATKIAMESISGHLFYSTSDGSIYEVYIPGVGSATDSLRYTSADHGITSLQGFYIRDSVMYLCGDIWASTTNTGKIVKGVLQQNGTRVWINVMTTDPYPTASSTGDHGFTGVCVDPAGNYIYVSSGARTDLGEIRTNGGAWPGCREVPITCRIFKFPINSVGIILHNDSALIDGSGYVFAWGTRNAYSMAWDGNDTLFAIDNSGERDDPDELNWLRNGKNYGYPWKMGSDYNVLMNPNYNVNSDPLVNHLSTGYLSGWFAPDSTFPPIPTGITFTDPVRNYGVAGDYYRDTISGQVRHASDSGTYITSFTAHRSPLGLVFDKDSILAAPYRGNGFILSFMPGGDSTGYTPLEPWGTPGPFVDPSRELVQMKLNYNSVIDNYTMTTSDIVEGFYLPVDAELTGNILYVIEDGGDIWKITFPAYSGIVPIQFNPPVLVYPNPVQNSIEFKFFNNNSTTASILITDNLGRIVYHNQINNSTQSIIDVSNLNSGIYFYRLTNEKETLQGKFVKE